MNRNERNAADSRKEPLVQDLRADGYSDAEKMAIVENEETFRSVAQIENIPTGREAGQG